SLFTRPEYSADFGVARPKWRPIPYNRHCGGSKGTRRQSESAACDYSKPSLRILEQAVRDFPHRNHGEGSQLTVLKATEVVTDTVSPALAAAGSGEMATDTPGTATLDV